jgi:polyisoprenoid-binding protein YceI
MTRPTWFPTALATGLAVALLSAAADKAAAADRFAIDTTHSNVVFLINHLGYSNMIGQFQDFAGEFTFDENDLATASLEVTIKADSVDTDHQKRDDHLRSPDFFHAVEFPEVTFVSTKAERTGDNTGRITGDFTLLGVTKPVTVDVTFNKKAPHPLPAYNGVLVAGFSARTKIKRSDFGMTYAVPGVGDEVTLLIEAEGHKKQ